MVVPITGGAFAMPACPPVGFPQLLGVLVALVGLPLHYWLLLGRLSFPAVLGRVALVGPVLAPLPPPSVALCLAGQARPRFSWVGGCQYYQVGNFPLVGKLPVCVTHSPHSHFQRCSYY